MTRCPTCGATTLQPQHTLSAIAPSGGEVWFSSTTDGHLAFHRNLLTEDEDAAFWKAKLAVEKPGKAQWEKAAALLRKAEWLVFWT